MERRAAKQSDLCLVAQPCQVVRQPPQATARDQHPHPTLPGRLPLQHLITDPAIGLPALCSTITGPIPHHIFQYVPARYRVALEARSSGLGQPLSEGPIHTVYTPSSGVPWSPISSSANSDSPLKRHDLYGKQQLRLQILRSKAILRLMALHLKACMLYCMALKARSTLALF